MDRYLGIMDTSGSSGENGGQHQEPTQSNWHCPTTAMQQAPPAHKPPQTSWHCSTQQPQQQQQQQQWAVSPDTATTSEMDSNGFNMDRKELWSAPTQAIPSTIPINQSAASMSMDVGEFDMKQLCGLPVASGGVDGVLDSTARPSLNGFDAVNSVVNTHFINTQLPLVKDAILQNQVERMAVMTRLPPRRQRSAKKPIPEDQKDDRYYEKRLRNNRSAKKSRELRKTREENIMIETSLYEQSNKKLRWQISHLNQRYQLLVQYDQKQRAMAVDGRLDISPAVAMPELEEGHLPSLSDYFLWTSMHVPNFSQKSELEQGLGGLEMEPPEPDKEMMAFLQQRQQPCTMHQGLQHSPPQLLQQTPEHQQQDMRTPPSQPQREELMDLLSVQPSDMRTRPSQPRHGELMSDLLSVQPSDMRTRPSQPRRGELMSDLLSVQPSQQQQHLQPLQQQKPDMQQEMHQQMQRHPRRRHRQSQLPLVDGDLFSELQQQPVQLMQGQEMHEQKHEMQHRPQRMQPQQRQQLQPAHQQQLQPAHQQQQHQHQLLHQQQVQMNTPVSNGYFNAPA